MKRLLIACLLVVLAAPAFAVIGTVDDVPAATLLLPYFEVDLDNVNGITTLMSINNASATAVLAHVVVWSDLSIHVLDFDVYLTGYDVQTINLRDIFVDGNLPQTASAGQDPGDHISPKGPASQDINFASCSALPYPALDPGFITGHLQPALTGHGSSFFQGRCAGINHDDRIARGYITVDTVQQCNIFWPENPGYFVNGGTGIATNQNVLWGDYFYVNTGENFAQGETLVHVEADAALGAGNYTFYFRTAACDVADPLCDPTTWGADDREGLGNVFAVRYVNGGGFDGGSSLLTWRDSKVIQDYFSCANDYPAEFPLGEHQVVVFDEQENFEVPDTGCTISPCPPPDEQPNPFPWEAQRTAVGGSTLPTTENFGWLFLNLNSEVVSSDPNNTDFPLQPLMQNWVSVTMDALGRFSVGFDAIQLGNVTDIQTATDPIIYY